MERKVGCLVGPGCGGSRQGPDGPIHSGQVGLGTAHGGQAGDLTLDCDAVVDNVVQLIQVMTKPLHPLVVRHQKLGDEPPTGGASTSNDVALVLQQGQRLSNAQTTHTKLFGQHPFGRQLVPRAKFTAMNSRPHTIGDGTSTGSRRNQRGHVHQCAIGEGWSWLRELSHKGAEVSQRGELGIEWANDSGVDHGLHRVTKLLAGLACPSAAA